MENQVASSMAHARQQTFQELDRLQQAVPNPFSLYSTALEMWSYAMRQTLRTLSNEVGPVLESSAAWQSDQLERWNTTNQKAFQSWNEHVAPVFTVPLASSTEVLEQLSRSNRQVLDTWNREFTPALQRPLAWLSSWYGEVAEQQGRSLTEARQVWTERIEPALEDMVEETASTQKRIVQRQEKEAQHMANEARSVAQSEFDQLTAQIESLTKRLNDLAAQHGSATNGEPTAAQTSERQVFHVVGHDKGWAVKQGEDASEEESVHGTKEEALERARALARDREPSRLVIHKKDGEVQEELSYG